MAHDFQAGSTSRHGSPWAAARACSQPCRQALLGLVIACSTTVAAENAEKTDAVLAGHSYHGETFNEGPRQAAYLMPGTGAVRFPVGTSNPEVQRFINQGVGQLHGFWYFEAERSFRQAAALEPDCAAAYWGMAMANANNSQRAKGFIEEAVKRKDTATDRVQRYITALEKKLAAETEGEDDDPDDDQDGKDRDQTKEHQSRAAAAYIEDLEQIVYDYPDDIEAKALIALSLWQGNREQREIRSHLAVDALIGEVLAAEPMHPAHHYRIHLWDGEKPARALRSAALCGQAAPSIAHMWHMHGHIYSRLHRYPDAVWQQEASARTDHAQMIRDELLPDQIHNFAHNNEWLIRNLIFVGRIHDALELAKNMIELPQHTQYNTLEKDGCSATYGRLRLLQVLNEAQLWSETLRLSQTTYLEETESIEHQTNWLAAVGRAHARLGNHGEADQYVDRLQALQRKQLCLQEKRGGEAEDKARKANRDEKRVAKAGRDARKKFADKLSKLESAIAEIQAYRTADQGDFQDAVSQLEGVKDPDPVLLAQWQMSAGNTDIALESLQKLVDSHENETLPLAHLANMQWRAARIAAATETMKKLRQLSAHLDLQAPPFARLAPIAAQLGWPRDWRIDAVAASDVGERPSLDTLGPFRWYPPLATDWTLPGSSTQPISLHNYRGQPVLVIFYLGWGCLHCAEQLQAFGPRYEDFRRAGIEMVAISSDDVDGLQKSLAAYDGSMPIPLVADPDLDVFRQYRVFDDFEGQPLHGTFLIDDQGRIRWHDLGYQPFMDHEFVLTEARRLLAQSPVGTNEP